MQHLYERNVAGKISTVTTYTQNFYEKGSRSADNYDRKKPGERTAGFNLQNMQLHCVNIVVRLV